MKGILHLGISTNTLIQLETCNFSHYYINDELHFLLKCKLYKEGREIVHSMAMLFYESLDQMMLSY